MPTVVRSHTAGMSGTETAPAGSVSVVIEMQGRGGFGGTADDFAGGGGGGRGGWSTRTSAAVSAGDTCAYNVDNGTINTGTGSGAFASINMVANPGGDGGTADGFGTPGSGGSGGTASGGTTNTSGGSGTSGDGGGAGGVGATTGGGSIAGYGDGGDGGSAPLGGGNAGEGGIIRFTYTTVDSIPNKFVAGNFAVKRASRF